MTVTVDIPPRHVRTARKLAVRRNRSFEEDGNWNNAVKSYGVDPVERNLRGLIGEFAFAEYADLVVDTNEYEYTDVDGDFRVVYGGERVTIDVKTAESRPYALFVKESCASADYYVLGHLVDHSDELDWRTVKFYGMVSREVVVSTELKSTPYDHRNHEVPITELDPLPEPEALAPVG